MVAEEPDWRGSPAPDIERHRTVVADVFAQCAILPAPPGTVFRSMGVLRRWLELHHTALLGGLAYIDGRAEGRVHVRPAGAHGDGSSFEGDGRPDLPRTGRDQAAWVLPNVALPGRDADGASASFLVDRSRWRAFADAVAAEQHRDPELEVRLTGPWPPYDFVRLQFGG